MPQRRRTPATEYFGAELRRTREEAGTSREELGNLTGYAAGTIAQLEIGEPFPQERFTDQLGEIFKTGRFRLIYHKLLRRDAYPESFRPWIDIEQDASVLRCYELSVTRACSRSKRTPGRRWSRSAMTPRPESAPECDGRRSSNANRRLPSSP